MNYQNRQNYQQNNFYSQLALPNSTAVLVLGICSLALCGIIGLVCGIIALTLTKKAILQYEENPEEFSPSSYSNLKAGKTCATIGVVLSSIVFLLTIGYFVTIISLFSRNF